MKKLLLSLVLSLFCFISFSQDYYRAKNTEHYQWNSESEEWVLKTKYSDLDIVIVIEDEFLTIQAKSPSMYKIFAETKEDITTKKIVGYRFDARDLKRDTRVKIDIVRLTEGTTSMISIINSVEGYNLRFFITPIEKN